MKANLLILIISALCSNACAQSNQVKAPGLPYCGAGGPNWTPVEKTAAEVAIDTSSGYIYQWHRSPGPTNAGSWLRIGQGIDAIVGGVAPLYAPLRNQSWFAINGINELYRYAGSGTSWVCLNCASTVSTDATLDGDGSGGDPLKIAQQSATSGQVLKWNGTTWLPAADDNTGTTYTAGTGVAISGGNVISNTGDLSATNELNTSLGVSGSNLALVDAGGTLNVPVSSIAPVQAVAAGTGISISGTTTRTVSSTITQADGSETVVNAGTGISVSGTGTSGSPYVVSATGGGTDLSISGSSSPLTIASSTGTDVTATAGTGISLAGTSGNMTITNTAPSLWTDGGTDTYLTSTTDNVAIGATAAGSKLGVITNSLGTTQTNTSGLLLSNNTAAAAGAQQISPAIRFRGNGWKTNATAGSQTVDFRVSMLPVQGAAAPTGSLGFYASINGGAYSNQLFGIGSDGHISMGTSANSNYVLNVNNTTDQIAAVIGNFNFNNAVNGGAGTGMGIAAFSGAAYLYNTNGPFSIKTATGFGSEQERLKADASGYISVGAGNATGAAWGLNGIVFRSVASACGSVDNTTSASATVTNNVANSFAIPAFAATNSGITYTNAANLYIAGAPTTSSGCGLNTPTLTNKYALWVDADATRLDGKVIVNGTGTPTDFLEVTGNVALTTAGNKLKIATGSNASIGTATLVAGTVTVSTTVVATGSIIMVSCNTPGGTQGILSAPVASIVNGTSFVINSSNAADTSTVNWWIIN